MLDERDMDFGEIRIGVTTTLVRVADQRGGQGDRAAPSADRAHRRVARGDAALAVDAASDSRHPERPDPPGTRRAGRHARPARSRSSGTWAARSRRSARSCRRSVAEPKEISRRARSSQVRNRPRVGHGQPRGRGRAVLAARRVDLQQHADGRVLPTLASRSDQRLAMPPTIPCGSWSSGRWRAASRRGRSRLPRRLRSERIPAERLLMMPRDRGHGRPFSWRDARGAQHRVSESGALDAELLAQARGARPPDGRRGARGEEPAQRDDDSPRAAEAEARTPAASRSPGIGPEASGYPSPPDVTKHVDIIGKEIRRLDEVRRTDS